MARPALVLGATPTPDRLLTSAAGEFAAHGFVGARLADIAAQAGVRRPSLIHHFKSKESLYAAVVEQAFADLGEALVAAMHGVGSFADRLVEMTERFEAFLRGRPEVAPLLLREILDGRGPGRDIVLKQADPMLRLVEGFLRREGGDAIPPGFPLRGALMQSVSNLLLWSAAGPLRMPLWTDGNQAVDLARALFGPLPAKENA